MFKIFKSPELRKKVLFSLFVIILFRLLAHVPVPGVDTSAVRSFLQSNPLLGLFNLFSGGGFENFSIVTLGLNPYINASIVIQMFTLVLPELERLSKEEGEAGREKINMYSRLLTIPFALLQAYGVYFLLLKQGVIGSLNPFYLAILILTLTAGTIFLMWIGELVTEYGVGQGISLLIFAGIIANLPLQLLQVVSTATSENFFSILILSLLTVLTVMGVVLVNEGTRNIPLEYGRSGVRSQKVANYLPIKVNQAGVIPIIFAVSLMIIPSFLSAPLQASTNPALQNAGLFLAQNFVATSPLYNILYFALVVGFTYFYTSIQFNPAKIAEDVKKRGGFVPGIRPGAATTKYLTQVINRITLSGALFLGLIAILPFIIQNTLNIGTLVVGGTSLLIVVSVILETMRQIESLMVTRSYQRYLD